MRFLLLLFFIPAPIWAQGRKPEETPKPESHPVQSAKDNANSALNSVDKGVHEALGAAKDGANKALGEIDKDVHKVVGSDAKK